MGLRPLASSTAGDDENALAMHVWCTSPNAPGYEGGSVTVAYTNAYSGPVEIEVEGGKGAYAPEPRVEYFITAPRHVLLLRLLFITMGPPFYY